MTLLSVRGIGKRFGGLQAVSDLSFDVAAGSIKALIGPNGAGKTTIFNLISGFLPPDSGEIFFGGRRSRRCRPARSLPAAWCGRSSTSGSSRR